MNPSRPTGARAARVSLLAAVLLAGLGSLAQADPDPVHPEYNTYHPSSRVLVLGDQVIERARVFDRYVRAGRNKSHHSCLVTDVPGYGAIIVKRMGLRVLRVRPEDLIVKDDLSRDVKAGAELAGLMADLAAGAGASA